MDSTDPSPAPHDAHPSVKVVGIARETEPGETRVALSPASIPVLAKAGLRVLVESGAGAAAGFPDAAYVDKGASIAGFRDEVFAADIVLAVRPLAKDGAPADLSRVRPGQVLVGLFRPLDDPEAIARFAETKATAFSLELLPRITRAQTMDVLSSQATAAGYRAVIEAAAALPKMFPLMTTAAGTITPARVLIIGAGVLGLQAIATARRLGALVEAYDVRPAVGEQVESLGARFVDLGLEVTDAEDRGGYAKEQGEDFLRRQREALGKAIAANDVVITAAMVPGKRAPVLLTTQMVEQMHAGSVIVDCAAEQGGNVEVSRPGERVEHRGVSVLAPLGLPAAVAKDASLMYAKNITAFLQHVLRDGTVSTDPEDEIVRETLLCTEGEVRQARVREALGLPPLAPAPTPAEPAPTTPGKVA